MGNRFLLSACILLAVGACQSTGSKHVRVALVYQGKSGSRIPVEGRARESVLDRMRSTPDVDRPGWDIALDSGRYFWLGETRYDIDVIANQIILDDSYGLRQWDLPELPEIIRSLERGE